MKIALIGSTQYQDKFTGVKERLESEGHIVRMPAFDADRDNILHVIEHNRDITEWCDEVHVIWDNRSSGTIFDFGMAFALRKKLVIEFIEPKTFQMLFEEYEEATR